MLPRTSFIESGFRALPGMDDEVGLPRQSLTSIWFDDYTRTWVRRYERVYRRSATVAEYVPTVPDLKRINEEDI
jgi:hypothetical protein